MVLAIVGLLIAASGALTWARAGFVTHQMLALGMFLVSAVLIAGGLIVHELRLSRAAATGSKPAPSVIEHIVVGAMVLLTIGGVWQGISGESGSAAAGMGVFGTPWGSRSNGNDVVEAVESFANQACACTDAACAEKVQQDFMKFIADNADKKGSDSDKKKVEDAAEKMMKCIMDAQAKGGGAQDTTVRP